jgi:hypothetical protein
MPHIFADQLKLCRIRGSHSGDYARYEAEGTFRRNVGSPSTNDTVLYPTGYSVTNSSYN